MSRVVGVLAGSATGGDPEHVRAAAALAGALARSRATVVFGGSSLGLMGVVGRAVRDAGGDLVGVLPEALGQPEFDGPQRLVRVPSTAARDEMLLDLCDAAVVLAGGAGILGEVSSFLLAKLAGTYAGPLVLLNVAGYYDDLVAFLRTAVESGFAPPDLLRHCAVVTDVDAAVRLVA